jgi:hypothetical protein
MKKRDNFPAKYHAEIARLSKAELIDVVWELASEYQSAAGAAGFLAPTKTHQDMMARIREVRAVVLKARE